MAWNIGTTTVRNPLRIRAGLILFAAEFAGNIHGREQEALFWRRLKETGIVDDENVEAGRPYVPTKEDDTNGRKWRATFKKLGFISGANYGIMRGQAVNLADLIAEGLGLTGIPYEVTPSGKRLMAATTPGAVQDIFLRQLLPLEITSPVETEKEAFQVKPLVLMLEVLKELENQQEKGVTREEIAAFVQPAHSHADLSERVDAILTHRRTRGGAVGRNAKSRADRAARDTAGQIAGIKGNSLLDYADTTFRYLRMTGLFSVEGKRLKLRQERLVAINSILNQEPAFIAQSDPKRYLTIFYKGGTIPTDDSVTALAVIQRYADLLTARGIEPCFYVPALHGKTAQEVETARHEIQEQYKLEREREFARSHAVDNAVVQDVLEYLKRLNGDKEADAEIEDAPTFLEWATWRGLLTFNSLRGEPSITRNFEIDEDMQPVSTAPGGRADIVMSYSDYLLVTEVTMMRGSRQEAAEGEPVRRHVADLHGQNIDERNVYGLFVAPAIDLNTTETFRVGTWYRHGVKSRLGIVPMTLHTYTRIVQSMLVAKRPPSALRQLLDDCLSLRHHEAPEWLHHIDAQVGQWVENPPGNN